MSRISKAFDIVDVSNRLDSSILASRCVDVNVMSC
jgi:hypothetical protein